MLNSARSGRVKLDTERLPLDTDGNIRRFCDDILFKPTGVSQNGTDYGSSGTSGAFSTSVDKPVAVLADSLNMPGPIGTLISNGM